MYPFVSISALLMERAVTVKLYRCSLLPCCTLFNRSTLMSTWGIPFIHSQSKQSRWLQIFFTSNRSLCKTITTGTRYKGSDKFRRGIDNVVPTNRLMFMFCRRPLCVPHPLFENSFGNYQKLLLYAF